MQMKQNDNSDPTRNVSLIISTKRIKSNKHNNIISVRIVFEIFITSLNITSVHVAANKAIGAINNNTAGITIELINCSD